MSTTEDDIRASIASMGEGGGDTGTVPTDPATPAAPTNPAPAPTEGGQTRDANGRFVGSSPASGDPVTPTPGDGTGQPAGGPSVVAPGAPGAPAAPATPAAAETGIFDAAKPPSGWTPDMKAKWDSVPEDIRKEITRREEASYQGFEKFRKQMEPAQQIYDTIAQHGDYLAHIQREPTEYLSDLMATEQYLTTGNPVQKLDKILEVADTYGVPLRQMLDKAMGGNLSNLIAEGHRTHNSPAPIPPEIMRELQQLRAANQKTSQEGFTAELNAMRADTVNFPLMIEAEEGMAKALQSGRASNFKEAYELAVWTDPALRAKAMAAMNNPPPPDPNSLQARQTAAAAAASPRSPGIGMPPAKQEENASTEDDIRASIIAMQNGGRA